MSKSEFDAFMQRQQAERSQALAFDPKEQIAEWQQYLAALYTDIQNFMTKYIEAGSAEIRYAAMNINEDTLGTYEVRQMQMIIGQSMITFTPIGTMLIGSKGRVDVQGPRGTARLVLINKKATQARQLISVSFSQPGEPLPPAPTVEAVKQIEWVWKIATAPPDMRFIELTDEAFFDMILSIANA